MRHLAFLAALAGVALATQPALAEVPAEPPTVPESRHPFAFTLNPAAALVGRFGVNGEVSPISHAGAVASVAYVSTESERISAPGVRGALPTEGPPPAPYPSRVRGMIGELGLRAYSDANRPAGAFVGVSVVVAVLGTDEVLFVRHGRFTEVGGALDAGYQIVSGPFVIGFGLGVQALHVSRTFDTETSWPTKALTQSSVLPRLLLQVGWAP